MNQQLEQLQGQIERITFYSEETGYAVAKIKVSGHKDLVTVIGNMINPTPGEIIKMKGEWGKHPQYGEQFKIVFCETNVPASVHGIEKYLGSGLIKGIGPIMAKRIVKMFKEETLNVIEHDIEKMIDVEGIGTKRIDLIRRAWDEQKEIRAVMMFLQSHGVSSGYAAKIFKQYGNDAIRIVQENPYRLATDIWGIGFLSADKIAEKLGFSKDSEVRAEAGILYVLHELADEGHVFYPWEPLVRKCREILQIEDAIIIAAIDKLAADQENHHIVVEDVTRYQTEDVSTAVYLTGYHLSETNTASRLMNLLLSPKSTKEIDTNIALQWVQEKLSIILAEKQIEAIRKACENKVLVITGGPGTGKTTIINAIIRIFAAKQTKILLAAPTGRAAKRMSETTGLEAKTIHRLLEFSFKKGGFQKNEENPLDCQLLIVDEASMIDTLLMHHLLKAVPPTATFILVGDVNQLPSVGPGNVLRDIIDSGIVPVVQLNEIFRQAKESSIIVNAHEINQGKMPNLKAKDKLDDFYYVEQADPQKAMEMIIHLVKDRIPKRFGYDPIDDIQVLTPMHKGIVGAANLNTELQKALNPSDDEVTRGGRSFKVHDKVMQISNDYDKDVYNGDIGRIIQIDREEQEVIVRFDDREVAYDFSDLDELVHAYAVSIHKSQGSEYSAVVIPILSQHYVMLQRNLLYTGVTRGKKLVVIVGTKKAMAIAVKNNKTVKRFTLLKDRLAKGS